MSAKRRVTGGDPHFGGHRRLVLGKEKSTGGGWLEYFNSR